VSGRYKKHSVSKKHYGSIRLKRYNYARVGAYFVTVCTQDYIPLFGDIVNGEMVLNGAGQMVIEEWERSAVIRDEIELDAFVVMPDHFHAIACVVDPCGRDRPVASTFERNERIWCDQPVAPSGPSPRSLGALIAGFKCAVTIRITQMRGTPGAKIWQRNYYDHIIRDENDFNRIREYINNNPARW